MANWEVVGGAEKGGILVREGQSLKSPEASERLSHGALVEELELVGERLHYKLLTGTGPAEGWVSLKMSGKDLLVKKDGAAAAVPEVPAPASTSNGEDLKPVGPGEAGPVQVDEALKAKLVAAAEAKQKEGALLTYCMKYKVLGFPLEKPKLRILCFHNAGSAESAYTGPATPFINWIKETKSIELLAFDYPGRDKLLKATKLTSTDTLSPDLLAVAYEKLTDGVPYIVWGHSVGTWVGFEFLMMARKVGLPMPKAAFFMAFPAPHMPAARRTWHQQARLNDAQFREELINWDKDHFTGPGNIVFNEDAWKPTWEPLMRADFTLFDEYQFKHDEAPKFDFPIHAWHMEKEHYNKADMIQMWGDWTSGPFDFCVMKDMGHLTCIYNPASKKLYFQKVTDLMQGYAAL